MVHSCNTLRVAIICSFYAAGFLPNLAWCSLQIASQVDWPLVCNAPGHVHPDSSTGHVPLVGRHGLVHP